MKIPFLDLREINSQIQDELRVAFNNFLSSGQYILGDELVQFEKAYATYCGASHAVGVGNGLDAISLALKVLGVRSGDEVLVPSNTFIATWLAVKECGATPIPVEPEFNSFNIDPARIENHITDKTRVIIPVHLFGRPANLDEIMRIAKKNKLDVLEDAAQCHGATYKGRPIGSHGNIAAWSFYPGKNLGALGDGGAITTSSPLFSESLRGLRNYGSHEKYIFSEIGVNSRLDPLQAFFLNIKLKYLSQHNEKRRLIAKKYIDQIYCPNLILPDADGISDQVWHLFVVRHPERDRLKDWLSRRGIQCGIHYPIPPHLQRAFEFLGYRRGSFPMAEQMASSMLSLPIGPHLQDVQVDFVIDSLNQFGRLG